MTWLGFAQPAWLAGLAALAVPLAIHLLSRGRQRRVPVGSVRWLEPAATLRARRLRLSRWPLLVLRCLLLTLLALLLAGPRLELAARPQAPWALVAPEVLAGRDALAGENPAVYARLDALLQEGATLRWLRSGLPEGTVAEPPAVAAGEDEDPWSLLREAEVRAPAGVAFEIFVVDRLAALRGERPAPARPVTWHAVVDPRPNRWVERAVVAAEGSVALTVGVSDGDGTRFERRTVAAPATADGWSVRPDGDGWRVELEGGDAVAEDDTLTAARREARVWLFHDAARASDAGFVRAGLEAAAAAGDVLLDLEQREVEEAWDGPKPHLVFWLSANPVGPRARAALEAGALLVSDALDRFEPTVEWARLDEGPATRFDRRGPVDEVGGETAVLWGTPEAPLLDVHAAGSGGRWLRFHGRFHPAWGELTTTAALPRWLLEVLRQAVGTAPSARRPVSDRRRAGTLGAPGTSRGEGPGATTSPSPGREVPTATWLWLAVVLAAAVERRLATGGAE